MADHDEEVEETPEEPEAGSDKETPEVDPWERVRAIIREETDSTIKENLKTWRPDGNSSSRNSSNEKEPPKKAERKAETVMGFLGEWFWKN